MEVDKSKLTFMGSMNYVVQVNGRLGDTDCMIEYYLPRKNRLWQEHNEDEKSARQDIEETIERMKIAITKFEEYLEGKSDGVYYWQLEKEPWQKEQ